MQAKKFHHIVLFRIWDGSSAKQVEKALQILTELGKDQPGIEHWSIHRSEDERKGIILIEEAIFENSTSFRQFHDSPSHQVVAEYMRTIADWWVGDYQQ